MTLTPVPAVPAALITKTSTSLQHSPDYPALWHTSSEVHLYNIPSLQRPERITSIAHPLTHGLENPLM